MMPKLARMAFKLEQGGARAAVDRDDLVNVAVMSLLKARKSFNPQLSSWKTYATQRAYGAMLDELRELDHVPRLERARAKKEGRELPRVYSMATSPVDIVPSQIEDDGAVDPRRRAELVDLMRRISVLVGERQRRVLWEYYIKDRTLREVGEMLGLSESRACQLHHKALSILRRRL